MTTFPHETTMTFVQLRDTMIQASERFAAISRSYDQLKAKSQSGTTVPAQTTAPAEMPATAQIVTLQPKQRISGNGQDYRAQGSRQALRRS